MAMRLASTALVAAGRSCSTSAAAVVGGLPGLSGGGVTAMLCGAGPGLLRSANVPAIVRAAEAATYNGRRVYCCGSEGRFTDDISPSKVIIHPKSGNSNLLEYGPLLTPSGVDNCSYCPYAKIVKLETELKLLQALSEQKEYDLKLESMRKEFQAQIAKIVSDFENKSAEQLKNFEDKYKSDKQNFDLRVQSIQFNVAKMIVGLVTITGGSLASYLKLKQNFSVPSMLSSVKGNPLGIQCMIKDWWE